MSEPTQPSPADQPGTQSAAGEPGGTGTGPAAIDPGVQTQPPVGPPAQTPPAEPQPPTEAPREERPESQDAPYYCPGCGRRFDYPQQCSGTPALPHAPIEAVSTDELSGDPGKHTPAPSGE